MFFYQVKLCSRIECKAAKFMIVTVPGGFWRLVCYLPYPAVFSQQNYHTCCQSGQTYIKCNGIFYVMILPQTDNTSFCSYHFLSKVEMNLLKNAVESAWTFSKIKSTASGSLARS